MHRLWNMIFFILLFGVHQLFCYVVCEYLHNVDEAASYLPLFCYRPVSLPEPPYPYKMCGIDPTTPTPCIFKNILTWGRFCSISSVVAILSHKGRKKSQKKLLIFRFRKERSIFQTFWKPDCCPNFLFFELETSNFSYLLIFWFPLTVQSFINIGQHWY